MLQKRQQLLSFIERGLRKLVELSHKILNGKLFGDYLG
jgi:hypothetical protein